MKTLYPLRFEPVYKDYIWGGNRIPRLYNRDMPDGIYAESWEISTHPDGTTAIANGPLAGKTLRDLLPEHKNALLGTNVVGDDFPLLIKLIDAREVLSVQVHPNDDNAAAVGGEAKTEMWYFMEGDPEAQIYCGLKPGIGKGEFLQAMEDKTFADILRPVAATPGQAVFVPGGRVHAIDKGSLVLEIQQNSNTTYRLYDWGRVGPDGQPRPLHIDQAMKVIDWDNNGDPHCQISGTTIQKCDYFQLDRFELSEGKAFEASGESFHALFVEKGEGTIRWADGGEALATGQSWLIPAGQGGYRICAADPLTVLRTIVP